MPSSNRNRAEPKTRPTPDRFHTIRMIQRTSENPSSCSNLRDLVRRTSLFGSDEIRVANEGKIRARWKFGKLLAKVSGRRSEALRVD